jgi:hypothetical protein
VRSFLIALVCLVALAVVQAAGASQVVSTSTATNIKLGVNDRGEAMITYTSGGKVVHVLAWGAINALPPKPGGQQIRFKLAYDGGYAKNFVGNGAAKAAVANLRSLQAQLAKATAAKNNPVRYALAPRIKAAFASVGRLRTSATDYWKTFTCPRYDGPPLAWMAAACKAPDGSYWAVQQWQRLLPDYGVQPTAAQQAWEVHLAHWRGPLPVLTISTDWAWHQWDHLYGTFTYMGKPVYGFHATPGGLPLDSFGRNVYVDTLDSVYGKGWRRENSFLTHKNTGAFCYSVNPHGAHPSGKGTRYRATIIGPGVTPDVAWEGAAPGPYSKEADAVANQAIAELHDPLCRPN